MFSSAPLEDKVIHCTTDSRLRGPGTDHISVLTLFELPISKVDSTLVYDWQAVNWGS